MIPYRRVFPTGDSPSQWLHSPITPTPGALLVFGSFRGVSVVFGLVLDATLTRKQREDALAHFRKAARIEAMCTPRRIETFVAYRETA